MTNPFKHLAHLFKDPINTIEEAETRKKEIMPWFLASIGVAVLFCVLDGILGTGILMVLGMIGIAGIIAFGFLLFVIGKAKEKFAALTCDKCNTMAEIKTAEEYAEFVSYTVASHKATFSGVSHPSSNDGVVSKVEAKGSANAVVAIKLKCPHCGNVKELEYRITPFKCSMAEEKVSVRDIALLKVKMQELVSAVVEDYNDPEKRLEIPYSIHSVKNPNYENRNKPQVGTSWIPTYKGVKINYHKDVEEMVEQFFLKNQLDGTIIDPNKAKKEK